jgi:uncharacterized protein YerC
MPNKSQKARQIEMLEERNTVASHLRDGLTQAQIAVETGFSLDKVRKIIDDIYHEYSERYMGQVERLKILNFQRIEHMLSVAMPLATGKAVYYDEETDQQIVEPPDRMWMDMSLKLIREETNLVKMELEHQFNVRQQRESEDHDMYDRAVRTLVTNDDLYKEAHEALQLESSFDDDAFETEDGEFDEEYFIAAQLLHEQVELEEAQRATPPSKVVSHLQDALNDRRDDDESV